MPEDIHFASKEAERRSNAYRHIHGIPAPKRKYVTVAGHRHKVRHSASGKRGKKGGKA
jgi:hypothetical protein